MWKESLREKIRILRIFAGGAQTRLLRSCRDYRARSCCMSQDRCQLSSQVTMLPQMIAILILGNKTGKGKGNVIRNSLPRRFKR